MPIAQAPVPSAHAQIIPGASYRSPTLVFVYCTACRSGAAAQSNVQEATDIARTLSRLAYW